MPRPRVLTDEQRLERQRENQRRWDARQRDRRPQAERAEDGYERVMRGLEKHFEDWSWGGSQADRLIVGYGPGGRQIEVTRTGVKLDGLCELATYQALQVGRAAFWAGDLKW